MLTLFFIINLVYLNEDTLTFINNDTTCWILNPVINKTRKAWVYKKAKVSDNHKYFFIYEEKYSPENKLIQTRITLYNQKKKVLWRETRKDKHRLSFELSRIYGKILIVVEFDQNFHNPSLALIKNKRKTVVIKPGQWRSIVDYNLSRNGRYLLLHTRRKQMGRVWDYVYFIDLKEKKTWEYLFPMCLACKRKRLCLKVDDQGQSEVIYKAEHRIFSKEGQLIHFYFKNE